MPDIFFTNRFSSAVELTANGKQFYQDSIIYMQSDLAKNQCMLSYTSCSSEIIVPLLLAASDKTKIIALSSYYQGHGDIRQFSANNGFFIEPIYTDYIIAYFMLTLKKPLAKRLMSSRRNN